MPVTLEEAQRIGTMKQTWAGKRTLAKMLLRGAAAKVTGKHWVTAGAALQGRMLQAALKADIDIRINAKVGQLLMDTSGAVTGVSVTIDGAERRIGARLGVLLNAGGFARNQRMRDTYIPGTSAEWTNVSPGDTGEMIEEGLRIGAAIAQMEERVGNHMTLPPNDDFFKPMIQNDLAKPHAILVDQSGVRYLNEGGSYMEFGQNMIARNRISSSIPSWMIFDSQYIRKYMLSNSMPGSRKPKKWFETGFLRKGETIEALATSCGIDGARLRETIERFNGFVRANDDADFQRGARAYDNWLGDPSAQPSKTLGTIEAGPFYAVQVWPADVGTFGGLMTDASARVLRGDGTVIPGLYATGTTTASVMGRAYPGAGASIGPSFTFGYIAAKHAARALGSTEQLHQT
jgi:3-oxosteroid 1-dehydrogenase